MSFTASNLLYLLIVLVIVIVIIIVLFKFLGYALALAPTISFDDGTTIQQMINGIRPLS